MFIRLHNVVCKSPRYSLPEEGNPREVFDTESKALLMSKEQKAPVVSCSLITSNMLMRPRVAESVPRWCRKAFWALSRSLCFSENLDIFSTKNPYHTSISEIGRMSSSFSLPGTFGSRQKNLHLWCSGMCLSFQSLMSSSYTLSITSAGQFFTIL